MLEGSKRNKDVYAKIAKDLEREGYKKSGEQWNSKIKRFKFEYKKMKDNRRKTGRGRKKWKFYGALDMILGHKPSTQPPAVVIKSAGCSSLTYDEEPNSPCPSTPSSLSAGNVSDVPQEDGVCGGDDDGPAGSADLGESSQSLDDEKGSSYGRKRNGKKRKRGHDNFEWMECLVEKMMKLQEESNNIGSYVKLEEKMLDMEERR